MAAATVLAAIFSHGRWHFPKSIPLQYGYLKQRHQQELTCIAASATAITGSNQKEVKQWDLKKLENKWGGVFFPKLIKIQ